MTVPEIELHSLTPAFDEASHGLYLKLLEDALGEDDIQNIALSGRYGIGKSSVLREFQLQRHEKTGDTTTISMPSLSVRPPIETGGESTTNIIQKEIVKQLLYRESANIRRRSGLSSRASASMATGSNSIVQV